MFRMLALFLAVLALVAFTAAPTLAEDKKEDKKADTHEGTFVKAAADSKSFTMKGKDDKEHSHDLATDAKISCDGKDCKLADLKAGVKIKVTVVDNKATKLEASTAK